MSINIIMLENKKQSKSLNQAACKGNDETRMRSCLTAGSLPCLFRNNSIENNQQTTLKAIQHDLSKAVCISKKYRKTSTALSYNVQQYAEKFGIQNLGFLTLTFKDHVTDYKQASKRFNSLATNILNIRYKAWLRVMERCKSGRIHYHLIVVLPFDARTGFDFQAIKKRDYSSASQNLRSEWAYWRSTASKFRFGRTELLPIKSSSEAIGRYVGKYIGKHMMNRSNEDKGARLVSYSNGCRFMNTKFSWLTPGSSLWRTKVRIFAYIVSERTGCEPTFEGLKEELGPKWAYNNREYIVNLVI